MAQATASVRSLAWNTPLITRRWLFKPSACNSSDVRSRFGHRAFVRPGHQNHGGLGRIAQGVKRGLEAHLLRLQSRVRPEAGCTAIIAI